MPPFPTLTADEAAALIPPNATVALSGFTAAGSVKAVPRALAALAAQARDRGSPYRLRVLTGASTGRSADEVLAQAEAIVWRCPYMSSPTLRKQINAGQVGFLDMHLSHVPRAVEHGFLGVIDVAVIEAAEITADGRVILTTSVGATPTFLHAAQRVIIELNRHHPPSLSGLHDILPTAARLHRPAVLPDHPLQRIGQRFAVVDPAKVVGVVPTDEPDEVPPFDPVDDSSRAIAGHLARFLAEERKAGRLPPDLLPIQLGVGNVANAVLEALGAAAELPPFWMYSEVLQESQVALLRSGRLLGASACALTLTSAVLAQVYADWSFFAPRLVLRSQDITNDPGAIRHLGLIALNTALEVDLYGHANSTHVCGTQLMNGVGGSGDFVRNAYLSVMMCPSTAKGGRVSTVVPMCSHVDQNEHSVQVIVTDQGLADLRGKGGIERARLVIERCAHPAYRDYLRRYLDGCRAGHLRHDLARCFELHRNLIERGAMLEFGEPI